MPTQQQPKRMKMTNQNIMLCVFTVASGLVCGVSRAASAEVTVQLGSTAAQSLIVQTGQTVVISASSKEMANVAHAPTNGASKYEWVKDGILVPEAKGTNQNLTLTNVGFDDVATYSVFISGEHSRAESAPVHLSVYSLFYTNSNGGVLTAPIGDFSISSGTTLPCGGTFDRFKAYYPFDGPNTSPPSSIFPNTSNSTNLDLTTCTNINSTTLDTGIRIQENWLPMNQKACDDDDGSCSFNVKLSTTTASGLLNNKTYRTTIYFNSATLGTNTTITYRWYYHN